MALLVNAVEIATGEVMSGYDAGLALDGTKEEGQQGARGLGPCLVWQSGMSRPSLVPCTLR